MTSGIADVSNNTKKPVNPRMVLLAAIMVPGAGHLLLGKQLRGAYFLFFSIVLGWLTTKIAPEHATFIGRHAGGFFIYALSLPDAYRIAKIQSFKAQQEKALLNMVESPPKAD